MCFYYYFFIDIFSTPIWFRNKAKIFFGAKNVNTPFALSLALPYLLCIDIFMEKERESACERKVNILKNIESLGIYHIYEMKVYPVRTRASMFIQSLFLVHTIDWFEYVWQMPFKNSHRCRASSYCGQLKREAYREGIMNATRMSKRFKFLNGIGIGESH